MVPVDSVLNRDQGGDHLHDVFQWFMTDDQRDPFFGRDMCGERNFDVVSTFEIRDDVFERGVVEDQTRGEPLAVVLSVDGFDPCTSGPFVEREFFVRAQRNGSLEIVSGDFDASGFENNVFARSE